MDHDLCKGAGWGYDPQQVPADLTEQLRQELHHMKVNVPMEHPNSVRSKPAARPSGMIPRPATAGPAKSSEKRTAYWGGSEACFPGALFLSAAPTGFYQPAASCCLIVPLLGRHQARRRGASANRAAAERCARG